MGQPAGRLFLLNGRRAFRREDLIWFERVARHVGPSVENIFLLRHLRARAIEGERSRISRDLHDGILQTLLSIEIQLDVLRRRAAGSPEQAAAGLANLQQTVKNESAELRHMVTDLRPLRVQSADLVDLMRGFAERYRNESTLALDVLIDSLELHAPDRVCREIFQIYREALNNIKKHAKASHVVVKLSQDDSRLVLVVDDNGEGFSFAGRSIKAGSYFHQGAYAYCGGRVDRGVQSRPWSASDHRGSARLTWPRLNNRFASFLRTTMLFSAMASANCLIPTKI
jgi:signal transduction histidine kinase